MRELLTASFGSGICLKMEPILGTYGITHGLAFLREICVIFCFKLRDQVEIISGNTHHYFTNTVESIELNVDYYYSL